MNTRDKKEWTNESSTTSTEDSASDRRQRWDRLAERAAEALNRFHARRDKEEPEREERRKRESLKLYGGRNRFYPTLARRKGIVLLTRNPISPDGPTEAQREAMRNIAGYHVEAGSREFGAFTRKMLDDVGESVIPHLQKLYEYGTMGNRLSEILEKEHKAGRVSDELYDAMKLKTAK